MIEAGYDLLISYSISASAARLQLVVLQCTSCLPAPAQPLALLMPLVSLTVLLCTYLGDNCAGSACRGLPPDDSCLIGA
jgi:hypothetical protein